MRITVITALAAATAALHSPLAAAQASTRVTVTVDESAPTPAATTGTTPTFTPAPATTPPPAPGQTSATLEQALDALHAPAPSERLAAARRLAQLGDRTATPGLAAVLRQDPDAAVRRAAAAALRTLADPRALPALREAAAADPSPDVRAAAAEAVTALAGGSPPTTSPAVPPPAAPGVEVIETGGSSPVGGTTELSFTSGDTGLLISRVVSVHSFSGYPGDATGNVPSGATGVPLCRTPCRIRVPNGTYTFLAGHYEFDVLAAGGTQEWKVSDINPGAVSAGRYLTYSGAGMLVTGLTFLPLWVDSDWQADDPWPVMTWTFFGIGGGMLAVGIGLWAGLSGSADLVSESSDETGGGTATALRLVPGPVALDPWTGRTAWGLRLAGSL